jgi:hypothetical protein
MGQSMKVISDYSEIKTATTDQLLFSLQKGIGYIGKALAQAHGFDFNIAGHGHAYSFLRDNAADDLLAINKAIHAIFPNRIRISKIACAWYFNDHDDTVKVDVLLVLSEAARRSIPLEEPDEA